MRILRTERVGQRIAIGIGVLVAALLLANAFMAVWTEGRMRSQIAAIRASGDPASIADLEPARIPAEENGAAILAGLEPQLKLFGKEHMQFYDSALGKKYEAAQDRGEPATAEQIAAIRAIVDKYPDLDSELNAVAVADKYASVANFSLDSQQFIAKEIQVSRFRTAVRFMVWRMEVLEAEGKYDEAVQKGITILRLARQYDHEPMLMNMLLACAVRGIAAEALYDALAAGPVSPAVHKALEEELAFQDDPQRMVNALKTERAFAIDSIGQQLPGSASMPSKLLFHAFGWPMKRYWIGAVDYLNGEIDAGAPPWFEAHKKVQQAAGQTPSGYGVLADLELPAIQAAYEADARTTAVLRALRIDNWLRQFAEKNGHEAASLDELGLPKAATIDPFSGQPLKLKHTEGGWIIYSVMRNGVDDGGDFMELKDFGVAPKGKRATSKEEAESSGDEGKGTKE